MTGLKRYPNPSVQLIKFDNTTTYTAVNSDVNKLIMLSNTSPVSAIINSSLGLIAGQRIDFVTLGSGVVTLTATGVTIAATPGLNLRTRYSAASLICTGANAYLLIGDLSA